MSVAKPGPEPLPSVVNAAAQLRRMGIESPEIGWSAIVLGLIRDLRVLKLEPVRLRSKYALLMAGVEGSDDPRVLAIGRELVRAARDRSLTVCQVCGRSPAAADWELEWVQTLCATHAAAVSR
jgi:hypothetical protein